MGRARWSLPVCVVVLAACAAGACRAPRRDPLRILLTTAPLSLDPHVQDESNTFAVLGNVFEGLTGFDAEMRVQPVLAERWENPDDLTWRFHLRRGVRFHDGRELEAADVVASLERARHHPKSQVAGYLIAVASVRAVDTQTVEIATARPYPVLLNKLTFVFVVPRDAPEQITAPIGTGPYRLAGERTAAGTVDLEPFDGYRASTADIPRLRFEAVEAAPERRRRVFEGTAEIAANLPEDTEAAPAGAHLESRPSLSVTHLGMRVDRPPLSDPRLRQAIAMALDPGAITRTILNGHGQPASQLISSSIFGFDPSLHPRTRDVAGARRLVAETGVLFAAPLPLEHNGSPAAVAAIRDQLAEAGIPVQIVPRSWKELYPRLVAGEATLYYAGMSCSTGDASDVLDAGLHTRDGARGYGDSNFSGYSSAGFDAIVEKSAEVINPDRRRTLLQAAMRRAMSDLPVIPLWQREILYGIRDGVTWRARADGRPYGMDMQRR